MSFRNEYSLVLKDESTFYISKLISYKCLLGV